jgi:hypothetical protein
MAAQPGEDEVAEPGVTLKGGPEAFLPHLGKCIAIVDGEVRASADDWASLIKAVQALGLHDPLLMFVPAQPVCA